MQSLNIHFNPTSGPIPVIQIQGKPFLVYGPNVPSDGTAGYLKGCIFMQSDGGVGTTMYVNEGTESSCDFNAK